MASSDTGLTEIVFKPCPSNTLQDWIAQWSADTVGMRPIRIVDDDPECRSYYDRLLKASAVQQPVLLAQGGKEAIEILKEETPALIVLDLVMPEVDGFAVLDWYAWMPARGKCTGRGHQREIIEL